MLAWVESSWIRVLGALADVGGVLQEKRAVVRFYFAGYQWLHLENVVFEAHLDYHLPGPSPQVTVGLRGFPQEPQDWGVKENKSIKTCC